MLKILVIDDERDIRDGLTEALEAMGHEVRAADSGAEAFERLCDWTPDMMLTDLCMPEMDGLQILRSVRQYYPSILPIVMTAQGSIATAIAAMKQGAFDYLSKPFDLDQLETIAAKVSHLKALEAENARLRDKIDLLTLPSSVSTRNVRMRKVIATAQKVAATDSTILITGESGTGKTLLAKILHDGSNRRKGPFGVVNCATLSENLLESELFGHVRGSFTGAVRDKVGRLQAAEGGTVFLDEIGEISANLQTKLLRFLQDREFERVGDTKTIHADVRVVAATNKNLEKAVKEARFREDLYFRLNVIDLHMPPLRERPEDLPELSDELLKEAFTQLGREPKPLSTEAREVILRYSWPGNIRELKNALERAAILCATDAVMPSDLPERVVENGDPVRMHRNGMADSSADSSTEPKPEARLPVTNLEQPGLTTGDQPASLEDLERLHIQRTLANSRTLEEAALSLGIDLSTLWRKRKQYGFGIQGQPVASNDSFSDQSHGQAIGE